MLIVFLVQIGPSVSAVTEDTTESRDFEAVSSSVVKSSYIIEGVRKDFEKFLTDNGKVLASTSVGYEVESSSSTVSKAHLKKTSQKTPENISENTSGSKENELADYEDLKLFMRRMLQVPRDNSNPAKFNRENFIKATYVTYQATEYLYSFLLCRIHHLSESPYLESLDVYQITRQSLETCAYAANRLSSIAVAFQEVIADDLKSLLPDNEPYDAGPVQYPAPKLEALSIAKKAPVIHEEKPSSISKIRTATPVIHTDRPIRPPCAEKKTSRDSDVKFFKNIHSGTSRYTFLKTISVLYEVIGHLLNALARIKDLVETVKLRPEIRNALEIRSALPEDRKDSSKISSGSEENLHSKEDSKGGSGSSKNTAGGNVRRDQTKSRFPNAEGQTRWWTPKTRGQEKVGDKSEDSPRIEETSEEAARNADANKKVFWYTYSSLHDAAFTAHEKYLREYFAGINVDVGPFDLHGNTVGAVVSEDGDSVVKDNSFQLTMETFTWRNAAEILRFEDSIDIPGTGHAFKFSQDQSPRFGKIHSFKLLALLEKYRNAVTYKFERPPSTVEQPFAEWPKNLPYPETKVVWNMDNARKPDFKFIIRN